jgi:hypothetical protein
VQWLAIDPPLEQRAVDEAMPPKSTPTGRRSRGRPTLAVPPTTDPIAANRPDELLGIAGYPSATPPTLIAV